MRIISFNINSLRARTHQLEAIINKHQPDVIGLQETKVHNDQFPLEELTHLGYHLHYHGQKSHYGVAMLTKEEPLAIQCGFPSDGEDAQRRFIAVTLPSNKGNITVMNGYFPQGESDSHETKYPAKRQFYADLMQYIQSNKLQENSIIMGDMNISPTDLDVGIAPESVKRWLRTGKCSFLPEERRWMEQLLGMGFIDTYREQNPNKNNEFSWFDYRSKGFDTNTGLRIDLILASKNLMANCLATGIDYDIRAMEKPSDHAPIWAQFSF